MIQSLLVRILLSPFSLLYGMGVSLRDFFYKRGLLKGVKFDLPLIAVGNLSLGGAGKSPHIEYLIRLLSPYINTATLSRGYKRKTKGYFKVESSSNATVVGDEPLQFKRKFKDVFVAVAESRTFAIPKMVIQQPDLQVILLDDAFQHRSIDPGLNILLTEFSLPFTKDYLLPAGRLREWRSAYKRADIMIVSKCPPEITKDDKDYFIQELNPLGHQKIYFSYYQYLKPYHLFNQDIKLDFSPDMEIILICAIAKTDYLVEYLQEVSWSVKILEYADHHYFSSFDISNLNGIYNKFESKNKVILTTEKDAMRLELHQKYIEDNNLPIFVLPVEVAFHFDEGEDFDTDVKDFLLNFKG